MAWQVSKRVWDSTRIRVKEDKDKFKPAHRLILLALAEIADEHGVCWPKFDTSYQTLADMAGIERRSAIRVIDDLIKVGYLWKSDTVGRGHSNIYAVLIGLSEPEKKKVVGLIGDSQVTNYEAEEAEEQGEMVSSESPIQEKMVTWESPGSDLGVTNFQLNGDLGVTHPILKNPIDIINLINASDNSNKSHAQEWNKETKTLIGKKFLEVSRLKRPRSKEVANEWWGQLYEIFEMADKDPEKTCQVIEIVVSHLFRQHFTIKGPGSLINSSRILTSGQALPDGTKRVNGKASHQEQPRASPTRPKMTEEEQKAAFLARKTQQGE